MTQLPSELLVAKELADACDVPMCLVDADGNPVHYNEAAKTILLGYRDAAAGLTLAELGRAWSSRTSKARTSLSSSCRS